MTRPELVIGMFLDVVRTNFLDRCVLCRPVKRKSWNTHFSSCPFFRYAYFPAFSRYTTVFLLLASQPCKTTCSCYTHTFPPVHLPVSIMRMSMDTDPIACGQTIIIRKRDWASLLLTNHNCDTNPHHIPHIHIILNMTLALTSWVKFRVHRHFLPLYPHSTISLLHMSMSHLYLSVPVIPTEWVRELDLETGWSWVRIPLR